MNRHPIGGLLVQAAMTLAAVAAVGLWGAHKASERTQALQDRIAVLQDSVLVLRADVDSLFSESQEPIRQLGLHDAVVKHGLIGVRLDALASMVNEDNEAIRRLAASAENTKTTLMSFRSAWETQHLFNNTIRDALLQMSADQIANYGGDY